MRFVTSLFLFILCLFCVRGESEELLSTMTLNSSPNSLFLTIILSLDSNRSCWFKWSPTVGRLQAESDPLPQPASPVNKYNRCLLLSTNYSASALEPVADCCLCCSRPSSPFSFSVSNVASADNICSTFVQRGAFKINDGL